MSLKVTFQNLSLSGVIPIGFFVLLGLLILEVLFSSLNSNMQQKVRVTFEIFHGLMVGSKLGIEKIFINFTAIIYFI